MPNPLIFSAEVAKRLYDENSKDLGYCSKGIIYGIAKEYRAEGRHADADALIARFMDHFEALCEEERKAKL